MKNQKGSGKVIAIVGVATAVTLALAAVGAVIGAANEANEYENSVIARYKNNQNILAQYGQKVQEAAQVPGMQAEDFKAVYTAALQGRYGDKGSTAVFQWIQEQNPQIGTAVYTKIQQIIEAGRNEFQNGQTTLLDNCRAYDTQRGYVWKGFLMRIAGYPKNADLSKMCTPITTARAEQAYEKGKEDSPLKLR